MDPKTDAQGLVERISAWAQHPWQNDLNMVDLALTVVFVATVVFFWWRLLTYIVETGGE